MAVGLRFSAGIEGLSSLAASAAAGWPCWSWLGAGLSHLGTEELWLWVGQLVSSQSPHLETTSPTPSLAAFPQLEVDPIHSRDSTHYSLSCAHPSRAQGVSSTAFAGGSHHLGQSGTLLTAHSELAAHLPGTTIPAHGTWITSPQDPEFTWIPVRTKGLGRNTFHHHSEHVSHCV